MSRNKPGKKSGKKQPVQRRAVLIQDLNEGGLRKGDIVMVFREKGNYSYVSKVTGGRTDGTIMVPTSHLGNPRQKR